MYKNVMEHVVEQKLDEIMKSYDGCKCERCRSDIAAITLNNLPGVANIKCDVEPACVLYKDRLVYGKSIFVQIVFKQFLLVIIMQFIIGI